MEQRSTIAALRDGGAAQAPGSNRDLRYDLFRGLALMAIFNDHVGDQFQLTWLKLLSLRPWGWSTGAELFVFISGLMFGMVYSQHLQRHGPLSTTLKALRRAAQLYFANFLTLLAVLVLLSTVRRLVPDLQPGLELRDVLPPIPEALFTTLTIQHNPRYFDILPLYVVLIGTAPIMLILMNYSRKWAMMVSVVTYGLAVSLARYRGTTFTDDETFEPFAWQFLFYLGAAIGHVNRSGQRVRLPQNRTLTTVAAIVVTSSLLFKVVRHASMIAHLDFSPYLPVWAWDWSTNGPPFSERVHLEPVRLIHFFSCAYLVSRAIRRQSPLLRSRWVRPFVAAGSNALKVFCVGVVLTYVTIIVYRCTHTGIVFRYAIAAIGVVVSLATGLLLSWWKQRVKQRERSCIAPECNAVLTLSKQANE